MTFGVTPEGLKKKALTDILTEIEDQQRVTREIIDFCGLAWDDRCLRFHEQRRVVQTASYEQVTKPIYTTSVARYKRFENHLGPLIDALGPSCRP